MTDTTLRIEIGDWIEEVSREEAQFADEDEMLREHVARKWSPLKTGRLAIAARHLGRAPEGILSGNKNLVNLGAACEVVRKFESKGREAKIGERSFRVPSYVGALGATGLETETYIDSQDGEALERVERYLVRVLPGHVWPRLLLLAEAGRDVGSVVEKIKGALDALVAEMGREVEPGGEWVKVKPRCTVRARKPVKPRC